MKSQSRTYFLIGCKEWIEDLLKIFIRDTDTIIPIDDFDLLLAFHSRNIYFSSFSINKAVNKTVQKQITENLGIYSGITIQFQFLLNVQVDLYLLFFQPGIKAPDRLRLSATSFGLYINAV